MSVIKIKIVVPEIDNVLSTFTKIQVQRSEDGAPYTDAKFITDTVATAAELAGIESGPFPGLSGKSLKLKVDGEAEQSVTFTLPDPISLANVIGQFNSDIDDATMSENPDDLGHALIQSDVLGTGGILEITGGTGLAILGFTLGDKDNGEDPNIDLLPATSEYEYDDLSGEASYWYRTRYYNPASGVFSSWSDWVQGSTGSAISVGNLIVGKIKLADIDGTALVGAKVMIVNVYQPYIKETYFFAGRSKEIETDGMGCAEITLVKGALVDVIICGTSLTRRIAVPSTGTEFDLMDPTLVQDDPFQIQVPDLPAAPRSS